MSRLLVAQRALTVPGWAKDALWRSAQAIPSLDLRFADNKSLVDATTGASLVTFTRASSGTLVGSNGVLQSAVTNLLLQSNQFDTTWTNLNSSETAAAGIAPDGTNTAWELKDTVDGSAVAHSITQSVSIITGTTYTYTVWMKAQTLGFGAISFPTAGFTVGITCLFNLSTGASNVQTGTATASTTAFSNGWYRCSVTATATASVSTGLNIRIANSISTSTYQGDGTGTILIYGAQLEQSSTVGEYIPTTSTINSAPRFDHNPTTGESLGLMVEEARTNNLLQSEDFSTTWSTSTASITTNAGIAPNGTTTADKLIVNSGSSSGYVAQNFSFVSGTNYAFSVYVKSDSASDFRIILLATSFGTTSTAIFNLTSGTVASSGGVWNNVAIVAVGNNWYRVSGNATATATASSAPRFQCNFTGDGVTGVLLWGAQLEAGAFPTSYIPTTTATVTRAADVASVTGSNFSSGWYNQTEGTVFADASVLSTSKTNQVISFNDGTNNNRLELRLVGNSADTMRTDCIVSGVTKYSNQNFALTGQRRIGALAIKANDFRMQSGASGVSPASDAVTTVDRLYLNYATFVNGEINGTIRRLAYWPTRLSNTTLQQITQP